MLACKFQRRPVGTAHTRQQVIQLLIQLAIPADVIANEQVQVAIAIVVKEGGAGAPIVGCSGSARRGRHVREFARTEIAKQAIRSHGRQINIAQAIAVIVPAGDPHSVARHVQTGTGGDVGELHRAAGGRVVAIQCRGGSLAILLRSRIPRPAGAIREQQILIAIAVAIEERHAAAHRFRQQLFARGAVLVNKRDTGLPRDVGEAHGRHRSLISRANLVAGGQLALFLALPEEDAQHGRHDDDQQEGGPPEGALSLGVVGRRQLIQLFIHVSVLPAEFHQPEILVARDAGSLQIVSDHKHRNFAIGWNHNGPGDALPHIGTMAAFLPRKPESDPEEDTF